MLIVSSKCPHTILLSETGTHCTECGTAVEYKDVPQPCHKVHFDSNTLLQPIQTIYQVSILEEGYDRSEVLYTKCFTKHKDAEQFGKALLEECKRANNTAYNCKIKTVDLCEFK